MFTVASLSAWHKESEQNEEHVIIANRRVCVKNKKKKHAHNHTSTVQRACMWHKAIGLALISSNTIDSCHLWAYTRACMYEFSAYNLLPMCALFEFNSICNQFYKIPEIQSRRPLRWLINCKKYKTDVNCCENIRISFCIYSIFDCEMIVSISSFWPVHSYALIDWFSCSWRAISTPMSLFSY